MKIFKMVIITVFTFVFMIAGIHAQQQKKKTVAVLSFVNTGGIDTNEIVILTNRFSNYLVNANVYKVLEREKMKAILEAQDFTMSDNCNAAECAVQIGQLLGVEYMVTGAIGRFGQVWTIDMRMMDVSSSEILKTKSEDYTGEKEGMLSMIEGMAYTISGLATPKKETSGKIHDKITKDNEGEEIKIGTVTTKYGSLKIYCEMDGVLFIDDNQIGKVEAGSVIPISKLKVGLHKIEIKSDFRCYYADKEIDDNSILYIKAKANRIIYENMEPFVDKRDGKTYKTVKIGNKIWMSENLNYKTGTDCYCYANYSTNCEKYGRLYTWEAAKKAVPLGWHLPTKEEFEELLKIMGNTNSDVFELINAYNSSGFCILYGGWYNQYTGYNNIEKRTFFWSSTEKDKIHAWYFEVDESNKYAGIGCYYDKIEAFSVRLVKD